MVAPGQTVEDGPPRDVCDQLLRGGGTDAERMVIGMEVRHPHSHAVFATVRLVVRAYQADGTVTASIQPWDVDDGA